MLSPFPTQQMLAETLLSLYESYILETWKDQQKAIANKYAGTAKEININARGKLLSVDIKNHSVNLEKINDILNKNHE